MSEAVINIVIIALVLMILAAIVFYIVKEKKNGAKCIGCPNAKTCGKSGGCGCSSK